MKEAFVGIVVQPVFVCVCSKMVNDDIGIHFIKRKYIFTVYFYQNRFPETLPHKSRVIDVNRFVLQMIQIKLQERHQQ